MTEQDNEAQLPLRKRMKMFEDVVVLQDSGVDTLTARRQIASRHAVTEDIVRLVESEGIDGQWPPL
jgi:hypothetical protein